MSYRLINANLVAESYTEVNDMPCIYADLPRGLDDGHYDMRGASTLQAENAKLRELVREAIYARDDADWASIVSAAIALGVEVEP